VTATACTNPSILTEAAAAVLVDLHGTQQSWQQQAQYGCFQAGSFEAVTPDGRLVSLNIIDGTLLIDGRPPRWSLFL
jgi:hypothetical protein